MEGFDQNWVQAGTRREARYTNLDHGSYKFRVRGSNNDGVWSDKEAVITLTIVPPFWKTGWFIMLSLVSLTGTFGAGVRYISVRKYRARLRDLEYRQKLQDERERISRDLHDHVGGQLVSIISGLDLVSKRSDQNDPATQRLIGSLHDDARESITQLRETIWALKTTAMDIQRFVEHVEGFMRRQLEFHESITLSVQITSGADRRLSPQVALTCLRIAQEAFTNIIKHAGSSRIDLIVGITEQNELDIIVRDNGIGFNRDRLSSEGNGLENMRTRAQELSGSVTFDAGINAGTSVHILLPVGEVDIPSLGD